MVLRVPAVGLQQFDAEFRRLAPLYPSTVLIDRDGREFHARAGLESVITDGGLPPFREIPYEDITRFEPMRTENELRRVPWTPSLRCSFGIGGAV